MNIQLLPFKAD